VTEQPAYRETRTKGAPVVGKRADLVVFDKNSLMVERMAIKEIQVLETIEDGKTMFAEE
jgi:predicted amidohydrolase YtcJ